MHFVEIAFAPLLVLSLGGCADSVDSEPQDPASSASASASSSAAAGGQPFEDIDCTSDQGCGDGAVDLSLDCSAVEGGADIFWAASVQLSLQAGDGGSNCIYDSTTKSLSFGAGGDTVGGTLQFSVVFEGAGQYQLGGPAESVQQLALRGVGGPPGQQITYGTTAAPCGKNCSLNIGPEGRVAAEPGQWSSFRFEVSCEDGVGYQGETSCGHCGTNPKSFYVDAACFTMLTE